jgi:hypothetical protein
MGDLSTHCVGKATDLNLMLKGCDGRMELHRDIAPVIPGFNAFYATEDSIFLVNAQQFPMNKGDLLVIFADEATTLSLGNAPALTCWAKL